MTSAKLTFIRACALAGLLLAATSRADNEPAAQPEVRVQRDGSKIVIDVSAAVAARPSVAWQVVTDYDHMTTFMKSLDKSEITSRDGNRLEVAQSGGAKIAFFEFRFSTKRAVELTPQTVIRSHLISGDFEAYDFETRIVANGPDRTTIVHHGEYVPKQWIPPLIGVAVIERETRAQYGQLIAEIRRRELLQPPQ